MPKLFNFNFQNFSKEKAASIIYRIKRINGLRPILVQSVSTRGMSGAARRSRCRSGILDEVERQIAVEGIALSLVVNLRRMIRPPYLDSQGDTAARRDALCPGERTSCISAVGESGQGLPGTLRRAIDVDENLQNFAQIAGGIIVHSSFSRGPSAFSLRCRDTDTGDLAIRVTSVRQRPLKRLGFARHHLLDLEGGIGDAIDGQIQRTRCDPSAGRALGGELCAHVAAGHQRQRQNDEKRVPDSLVVPEKVLH